MFAFLLLFTIRYCNTEMITSTLIYVFQLCVHLLLSFTLLFVYSSSSFPYMSFRAPYEWSMISRCKCHIPSRQHHPTTPKTTSYTSRGEGGVSSVPLPILPVLWRPSFFLLFFLVVQLFIIFVLTSAPFFYFSPAVLSLPLHFCFSLSFLPLILYISHFLFNSSFSYPQIFT